MKMNRETLIQDIMKVTNLTSPQIRECINGLSEVIYQNLKDGNDVHLNKVGYLTTTMSTPRMINLPCGSGISKPKRKVKFRVSTYLEQHVQDKKE